MLKKAFVFVFVVGLIIGSALYFMGPGLLKRKLKKEIFSKSQIELEYDTLTVLAYNPLKLSISNITVKKTKELDATIKTVVAELNLLDILTHLASKSVQVSVIIDDLKSNVRTATSLAPGNESASSGPIASSFGTLDLKDFLNTSFGIGNLNFLFKITKFDMTAQLEQTSYRVNGNDLSLKLKDLDSPIQFDFAANLFSQTGLGPLSNIYVPIKSQSEITINHGVLNLVKSETTVADIKNSIRAQINLNTLDFDTNGKINIPDIAALPFIKKYQAQLPISDPTGILNLEVAAKGNVNAIPAAQVKGQISLKSFTANFKFKNPDISFQGPVNLELGSTFTYMNRIPALSSASWKVNLDEAEISYKDLFYKNKSVRLATEGTISYSSDLTIDRFRMWFHTMDVSVNGMASMLRASDLTVAIKPFKLQEFKKFLPNNKDFDISGDVELDGQIKGFLNQPKYLTVNLRKIQANNLKYYLKFKNDLISIDGPLSLTVNGKMLVERSQVLTGSITGHSDFTPLTITQGTEIRKTNTDLLKADWSIQAKDGKLNIEKLYLNTFLTTFTLKGTPPLSKEDSFNVSVDLDSLNWKKVKPMLPANEWLNTVSDMKNKGHVTVKGKLDPFQPIESQFAIDADLETTIDSVSLPFNFHLSKQPPANPAKPEPKLLVPEAFVSTAPLLRKIHWDQKVIIQNVSFKDSSKFQNITLAANLANNNLRLNGEVKSLFNGSLTFTDVNIPLTEPDPKIKYTLNSANISFSPLVDFVMPEYKELISGVANFEVTGQSKMPGTLNFKNDLVAKGRFRIPTSEVNMLKLVDEMKQKFSAAKDIGVPSAVPVSNLNASTESEFEIKSSKIQLTGFKAVARNNDEINLNGQIQFDLESKIEGVFKLVNLPAQGDFLLANQNKAGQIEVPISIEGNLKQPKWSFAGNTFDKMTQKFIDYQKNKVKVAADRQIAQAKDQANAEVEKQKKAAEKQLEDKKKEFENAAKKKLGDLFK